MELSKTKQVVILCGPRPSYGYCPLPPLTNSAPEKNIYRLAEFDYGDEIQITVISACGLSQVSKFDQTGKYAKYTKVPFPDWFFSFCQNRIFHIRIIETILNYFFRTYDLFSAVYLSRACLEIKKISPDLILINSLPQYMQFIKHRFPTQKIGLFVRGEIGSSRKYLKLMDCIITNSTGISEYVKGLLNGVQIPIEKIPNCLDNSFCTSPKDYSTFRNQVIYTGRIEEVKGVFELLKAFKIVQEQLPKVKLKIIGGNFTKRKLTDYEQLLIDYVTQYQLNVMFTGEIPNKQLPDHLLQADLAIYPSICLESFGMTALEAMRCGLPVIASRRPGFEELIENGQTGIIIDDPGNIEILSGIIIKLLRQPSELKRMGENGYARSLRYLPELSNSSFRNFIFYCLNLNVTN